MTILSNKAQCARCKDIIESTHRHDFVACSCGTIFVDGGKEYLRRGFAEEGDIIELSETIDEPDTVDVKPASPYREHGVAFGKMPPTVDDVAEGLAEAVDAAQAGPPPRLNFAEKTPGFGDGNQFANGDVIVSVQSNMTHLHLPGDFIKRDVAGESVLMKKDKYEAISAGIHNVLSYWAQCSPMQRDLSDHQIAEINRQLKALYSHFTAEGLVPEVE